MSRVDEEDIRQRLADLFAGWSPGVGDFDMGRVAAFYHEGDRFLALDTLMPTTSVMDGWQIVHEHLSGPVRPET